MENRDHGKFRIIIVLLCLLLSSVSSSIFSETNNHTHPSITKQKTAQPPLDAPSEEIHSTDTPASPKNNGQTSQSPTSTHAGNDSLYGISFYEPTYALPFYYTFNPDQAVYQGYTPENQRLLNEEFKGQLSFKFPLWADMFGSKFSIAAYYTQLSYWQFYAKSQYFRETDYEPALYIVYDFLPHWSVASGLDHQSNGRGGNLERSWNRVFFDLVYASDHWYVSIKPWFLVFKSDSSDLHNPNITDYLGYGRIVVAFQFYEQEISVMVRNAIESDFSKGAIELDYSFPIHGVLHGYIQFFSGYGQSLIEYDHYTNSVGVGIAISNWI